MQIPPECVCHCESRNGFSGSSEEVYYSKDSKLVCRWTYLWLSLILLLLLLEVLVFAFLWIWLTVSETPLDEQSYDDYIRYENNL